MTIAGAHDTAPPHPPVRPEAAFVRHAYAPFPLRVEELVHEIPGARLATTGARDARITGVHHDSRRIEPGDLFVARAGAHADGARFVAEAVTRGARAVLATREVPVAGVAKIEVDDVPSGLAYASAAVYGHPTFGLEVVGITGTNGKTTTAHLVQAVIEGCGGRAGIIGTLGARFADLDLPPTLTSTEADELARIAAAMRARGAEHLVMEVSSIALIARRSDAVRFRVAAFTNLTQDHLDYHGSMDAYAEAKARLFVDLAPGSAAINVDDPFGRELARRVAPADGPRSVVLARFSTRTSAGLDEAEVAPLDLAFSRAGIAVTARTPAGVVKIASQLFGAHNAQNLLAALSIAWLLDLDVARAAEALSTSIGVPGRLERCDTPGEDDVIVLVDYAHTPDALARVLESVRILGEQGRIVCVFGCGGDRDPQKRPLMGAAVGRGADVAIVTNDNPRSEDPRAIADAILPGLEGVKARVVIELDRRAAIELAVVEASPGDVILLAGKGHEPYQILGATTHAFDDRDEARRALSIRRATRRAR
ncbi:MAG: UDP-N-acetylmuramoyl-L-alanyl-D-glutamate--2,6-diaminopimelate ligase [Byssovorax sp.]